MESIIDPVASVITKMEEKDGSNNYAIIVSTIFGHCAGHVTFFV